MTPKMQRFCDEYLVDMNATKAAVRAGYSEKTAFSIGWENLRKPEIREYIDKVMEERSLGRPETLKGISDIARANLNDYFKTRQIVHVPKIKISLAAYIEMKRDELQKAEYIHDIAKADGLLGTGDELAEEIAAHNRMVRRERYTILRLEVELTHNPDAYRIISGPEELVEVVDVDLPRLVKDKEAGRIKSFKMTEFGPQVELYPADAALRDLAKIHGLFEKDNKQKLPEGPATLQINIVRPLEDDD